MSHIVPVSGCAPTDNANIFISHLLNGNEIHLCNDTSCMKASTTGSALLLECAPVVTFL